MIYIYGSGGHARVVADAALACGLEIAGFFDDDPARWGSFVMEAPVLSPQGIEPGDFVAAIGSGGVRQKVASRLLGAGWRLRSLIHPRGCVSPRARLEAGVFVAAMAVVGPDAQVGEGAIVNHGAVVDHDCDVGAYAHVAPNATLGGGARLGVRAMAGAGSVLLPQVSLGDDALLGAGAVATRDLAAGMKAAGAPARPLPERSGKA
ncbi:acetyltransferase [Neomegalonema sp.]|uniref:acetyltransferase n=1 Tax=Neomegalonema sp. TaxID=2039713 RepID=UPI002618E8C8|nr:acetyltransferase [Neomegalonema sp.]MDD2868338.1 acetyltransferase [Neomegalonema sp.]